MFVARDAEIAAASRVADLGNSVSNSVINHTGFQKLVSDTTIEKDVRLCSFLVLYQSCNFIAILKLLRVSHFV